MDTLPVLTETEARVLAVLIEKEKTVPDSYPLSSNSLQAGCNQKTAREPVMSLTEAEIQQAIDGLKSHTLVMETSGGRVMRYAQNARRVFKLPEQSIAILAVLMLRGPQTAGELRLNCDRLHAFGDISSVEAFLTELAEASAPWVLKLPKQAGSREHRWAHLLCGEVVLPEEVSLSGGSYADLRSEVAELKLQVAELKLQVAELRQQLTQVRQELGISDA